MAADLRTARSGSTNGHPQRVSGLEWVTIRSANILQPESLGAQGLRMGRDYLRPP